MAKLKGPRFIQYFQPVIDGLRDLGSSAKPKEVYSWIAEHQDVPKSEIEGTTKGGQSKFENKVGWARFYLAKAGLIDTEQRGVWVLTELGRKANLTHDEAYQLFRSIHDGFPRAGKTSDPNEKSSPVEDEDASAPDEKLYLNQDDVQERLVELLRSMTDKGFEELCARLLRHIGFENVKVTGQRGDQGVDGEGYLLINRFVRTKVMFQCKRYEGTVGPDKIRDFRGAISGRAERGIFLTTGSFTRGAVTEAARENTTAIELVDIDRLLELMIEEGLGVKETKALTIEDGFFEPYLKTSSD
ncbi:restriction endonuclease [Hwanghaeella grinnelliae]|uniref:Restriction endonuclease n=1 Tax=Hwanghaeella grinnelliae TaxID=2500179 RepID=A0A3S2Y095_9PROT|nr:restriction endonuclease [Hwanghaeella grinnelliae]RVU33948.1 restriction endonuclease [Hwanghaeella grinnelliae]